MTNIRGWQSIIISIHRQEEYKGSCNRNGNTCQQHRPESEAGKQLTAGKIACGTTQGVGCRAEGLALYHIHPTDFIIGIL